MLISTCFLLCFIAQQGSQQNTTDIQPTAQTRPPAKPARAAPRCSSCKKPMKGHKKNTCTRYENS